MGSYNQGIIINFYGFSMMHFWDKYSNVASDRSSSCFGLLTFLRKCSIWVPFLLSKSKDRIRFPQFKIMQHCKEFLQAKSLGFYLYICYQFAASIFAMDCCWLQILCDTVLMFGPLAIKCGKYTHSSHSLWIWHLDHYYKLLGIWVPYSEFHSYF